MTTDRDFKRLVRGRMQKTGESYTTARAQLLRQPAPRTSAAAPTAAVAVALASPPPAPPAPVDYARIAGFSDAAVKAKTGCGWDQWVYVLDRAKAHEWSHAKIVEYVRTKYKAGRWWGQMVTVGYERIRGLRARGQRRNGTYETSKSKTLPIPLTRLYQAFSQKRIRDRWLPGVPFEIRSATRGKYLRLNWPDGTSVEVGFLSKGRGKAQVAVQHTRLPDQATALRMKAFWGERLEALASLD
jgi:hypothetical protein